MTCACFLRRALLSVLMSVAAVPVWADPPGKEPLPRVEQPVFRVAKKSEIGEAREELLRKYADHPLAPVLRQAYEGIDSIRAIKDYTGTMIKRERIDGVLGEPQYLFVKIRQQPFSVYTYFLKPNEYKGREAIYVAGQNDGKLIAHEAPNTLIYRTVGTVRLDPKGVIAMRGQRYPITNSGVLYLAEELIRNGEHDIQYGECEVKLTPGVKINGRSTLLIQVVHPIPRKTFRCHMSKIYIDDEYQLPVRYESYDWPKQAGQPAPLIEEYTYVNLKFNVGLTDKDFDEKNPEYNFR